MKKVSNGLISGKCFDAHYLDYIHDYQRMSLYTHQEFQDRFQAEDCLVDFDSSSLPQLEPATTTTQRSIDRESLLRRYLRHPAISNFN